MSETLHQPSSQDEHSHRNVYAELKAGLEKGRAEAALEKQKAVSESQVIDKLLEKYPTETQHTFKIGGIEIITCGETATVEQVQTIVNGLKKIHEKLGNNSDKLFPDLKVYIADSVVSGGAQAFGRENVVIMDSKKMTFGVGEVENMLSPTGEYRIGDRSSLVDSDIPDGEPSFVHELGHILEFKAQGDYDKSFATLERSEAPTLYGQQNPREDYAESWMYYIYDGKLDPQRVKIIKTDIEHVLSENK